MRAIWSGSISFGLVNIPVKVYSGVGSNELDFDMLERESMSPIRYARISEETGKEVPYEDIVKGFEVDEGRYVVLEKEDFEKASGEKSGTVDILDFVELKDVEPVYFEKPYFLEPDGKAHKPYLLLRDALSESGKVAVTQFMMRNRERLGVIMPWCDILILNQLRYMENIRDPDQIRLSDKAAPTKKEQEMALKLVDQMTQPFNPKDYKDTYVDELRKIIEAKAQGRKSRGKRKEREPEKVGDLMESLRASLAGNGQSKGGGSSRKKKSSSK